MTEINKPMRVPELKLQPPITSKVRLSDDMQQTLALLTGYTNSRRMLLTASETGVLNSTSPQIKDILVHVATPTTKDWNGGDIPCTEIAVIAGLNNDGKVWVRPYSLASAANAWPLNTGESFGFSITNLNQLHVNIQKTGDIAIIAYTR